MIQKTSLKPLVIFVCLLAAMVGVGILSFLAFLASTVPEPKIYPAHCLDWNQNLDYYPSLAYTDNAYVTMDFGQDNDDFRVLNRWKIADRATAWKNSESGKIVFDESFFTSVTGGFVSATLPNEARAHVVAVLNNPNFTDEQFRELAMYLIDRRVIDIGYHADACLRSEVKTISSYQADFSVIRYEYTNSEAIVLHDLSISFNKMTGETIATTTYRKTLLGVDFGRYRVSSH